MKKLIAVVVTLVTIVAVNTFAGKIPEAKKTHPKLYTIQFTFARYPTHDNVMINDKERKRAMEEYECFLEELEDEGELENEEYENLLKELGYGEQLENEDIEKTRAFLFEKVMHRALINHIESSKEVEYIDIATIYTRSGEPFPEEYGNVKGFFDIESNTLILSELNSEDYRLGAESSFIYFYVNVWGGFGHKVGGENNGYLLIKCYPPTNVSSSETE